LSFLGAFEDLRKATTSSVMSVHMGQLCSHCPELHQIWYIISENVLRKFKLYLDLTRITGTWREDLCPLTNMSRRILLRNTSDKICRENQNTHLIFNNFYFKKNPCRLSDNFEKYSRAIQATNDKIIWRMHIACL